MGIFFVYILKSTACLASFYLFYRLLLSRDTFHRFNRMALLGTVLLSVILPFVKVQLFQAEAVERPALSLEQLLFLAQYVTVNAAGGSPVWIRAILVLYLSGILFFAMRFLYSVLRIFFLIRGEKYHLQDDGTKLILTKKKIAPFSWMNYVLISEKDWEESGKEILAHERGHIQGRHSWDMLLAGVHVIFHWFNPAAWLLKQELQNIHEYEADEYVLNKGIDAKKYQLLLIKKAVGSQRFTSMANSFSHSKLKKRITMMLKSKSNPWARMKYLYILPLAAVMVTAFAHPEVSNELEKISVVKITEIKPVQEILPQETIPENKEKSIPENPEKDILYIVDGREVTAAEARSIPMPSIETVSVNKSTMPTGNYAVGGKDGVIRITTTLGDPILGGGIQMIPEFNISKMVGLLNEMDHENVEIDIHIDHERIQKALESLAIDEWAKKIGENIEQLNLQELINQEELDRKVQEAMKQLDLQVLTDISINQEELEKTVREAVDPIKLQSLIELAIDQKGLEQMVRVQLEGLEEKLTELSSMKVETGFLETNRLILIDGVEATQQELDGLNQEKIESVHIYKREDGVEKYGEKAANGVIEVITKK